MAGGRTGAIVGLFATLCVGLLAPLATAAPATAAPPAGARPTQERPGPPPERVLPRAVNGAAAVAALRKRPEPVAARHGMQENELEERLVDDPTLWVDETLRLFYVEPALTDNPPVRESAPQVNPLAPFPLDETFELHSRPGAQRVIYLDFDGHEVTGTGWNNDVTIGTGSVITVDPYSIDEDPLFSAAERAVVQDVWRRVAEDYAPFEIDVTTQDPGFDAINRAGSGDQAYGTRAVIDGGTPALACDCGGLAYVNTFNHPSSHAFYQPAFVLQDGLGGEDARSKDIAEAVTHEVGHNLGLSHDGAPSEEYYEGHAAWAPIMGVGYYRPVVQWSRGEYAGANNVQNDLGIIAANGAPLRADDHGDTAANATALGSTGEATGRISTATDVDAFAFTTPGGPVSIQVDPTPVSPNLDVALELRNALGQFVAGDDPPVAMLTQDIATGLAATIDTTVPPGVYVLLVRGTGFGTPTTGYSDYGSLGTYTVRPTGPPPTPPDAPTDVTVSGSPPNVAFVPGDDGGSPITSYRVHCASTTGANRVVNGTTPPIEITTLTPGATYRCRVRATNAIGDSPYSPYSGPFVPTTAPAPPTDVTVSGSPPNVAFVPGDDGGSPITSYRVHCASPTGANRVVNGTTPPIEITTLTPGATYRCRVRATNAIGDSPYSPYSGPFVPTTAPAPPTDVTVSGSPPNVAFVPGDDGGSPITSYRVHCASPTGANRVVNGTTPPIEITTLTPGATYRCRVRATNAIGDSPYSPYSDPFGTDPT